MGKRKPRYQIGDEIPAEGIPVELNQPLIYLGKDIKAAARDMKPRVARWFIRQYYVYQSAREGASSQNDQFKELYLPNAMANWSMANWTVLENAQKAAIGEFALEYKVGNWLQSNFGIGPVISAVLVSSLDPRAGHTVGSWWRFIGMDPTRYWIGRKGAVSLAHEYASGPTLEEDALSEMVRQTGCDREKIMEIWREGRGKEKETAAEDMLAKYLARCPWNMFLKSFLLYGLGETMIRASGPRDREKCFYGKLYSEKFRAMWDDNCRGAYVDKATRELANLNNKESEAYGWKSGQYNAEQAYKICTDSWKNDRNPSVQSYPAMPATKTAEAKPEMVGFGTLKRVQTGGTPMLPPGQVRSYARRWMVKLFICHYHEVSHWDYYGCGPTAPYIFQHPELGHVHKIEPPNWPAEYPGKSRKVLFEGEPLPPTKQKGSPSPSPSA